jgi:RecB family endonuclease NucS
LALKKTYLEKINKAYEVGNPYDSILIEDLHTDYEQAPLRLELQYERLLHPYFLRHQDVSLVDEKAIEEYVARHLEDVEAGLRLIGSQIVLERGRIDLLARDTNGVHVIIEVKVATDTDLVWQQSYYMKEIQKMYGGEVRFMVIAPKWEPHIMEMLLKSPNTEIYLFTPDIKQKEIRSIDFHKRVAS